MSIVSYSRDLQAYLLGPEIDRQMLASILWTIRLDAPRQSAILTQLRWGPTSADDMGRIFSALIRVNSNSRDPEGIANETLLEMYRRYGERGLTPLEALSCATTIAKRMAWREHRRLSRLEPLDPLAPAGLIDIEGDAIRAELVDRLIALLPHLTSRERMYLELRLQGDVPARELAEELGVPAQKMNNFYQWTRRLLLKVRGLLEEQRP